MTPSPRGHYANILPTFMIDMPKDVSLLQPSYTLPLPSLEGPHLRLQCLHLLVQLGEPLLDMTEAVDFSAKGPVPYPCQHVVNARCIHIVEAEGYKVVGAETGYASDVEYRCRMNEPLVDLSLAVKHAVGVGVVGHFDFDVFGRYRNPVPVDDVKRNVLRSMIHFESGWERGLGAQSDLDADRVSLPGVIEPDRAFFCFAHTSSTSSSTTSVIAQPFGILAYARYLRSIFVVFFIGVDIVPVEMSRGVDSIPVERLLPLRASWQNSIEGPQGVSQSAWRSHKDRVGTRLWHPVSVGSVAIVIF